MAHQDDDQAILDGEVLDDLADDAPAPLSDDDSHDEQEADEEAGPSDHPMVEDESLHSFEGHTDGVMAVAWSPAHPDLVATGGLDDRAFLWRVGQDAFESTSGTLSTFELAGHTDTIASMGFNLKGTLLATGGMDGVVKIWNTTDGQLVQTLEGPADAITFVQWHPKGDVVLAGAEDFSIWMWLAQMGNCMQVFTGHQGSVTSGGFTPDGKAVVSTGGDGDCTLRVWSPKTGECTHIIRGHPFHEAGLTCSAIHHDSSVVLTGAEDGSLRLSNIQTGKVIGALEGHEDSVEAVGFSRHLPLAATAGVDGKMMIWDLASLAPRGVCQHPEAVVRMAWHPTQPLVFTACTDGVVRCWDLRTSALAHQFTGHTETVQDLALSPDGSMVLTGGDDGTAKVFKAE